MKKRLENAKSGEQAEGENVNDKPAELGAGEVFEVVVVGHEGETDAENPADDRDREEEGVGEVAPHRDWSVAIRDSDFDCARGGSSLRGNGFSFG